MFRKAREKSSDSSHVKPSIGRPPTPPNGAQDTVTGQSAATMATRTSSTKPLGPRSNTKANVPSLSRPGAKKAFGQKTPSKPNSSILSFFKKVELPDDGGLFLSGGRQASPKQKNSLAMRESGRDILNIGNEDDDLYSATDGTERYNESGYSMKRRKMSGDFANERLNNMDGSIISDRVQPEVDTVKLVTAQDTCSPPPPDTATSTKSQPRRIGAFIDDSESEAEEVPQGFRKSNHAVQDTAVEAKEIDLEESMAGAPSHMNEGIETKLLEQDQAQKNIPVLSTSDEISPADDVNPPSLKREETSYGDYGAFHDVEEYPDVEDEFADGEEFMERKWMEEQESFETLNVDIESNDYPGEDFESGPNDHTPQDSIVASCPICESDLAGISPDEATRHVNVCLDGGPILVHSSVKVERRDATLISTNGSNRLLRAAIARPGQKNPFQLGNPDGSTSSAFSKLMSSNVEDAAWADAAAAETAARGKAAYQRTCPFYKIMPGFYITVDAFRYGSIQGCNAYFLSHFHSDHYIGLTSKWCHGPIYCSKVTANLVKQQLRVDPKWVVALDFEQKIEVAGTEGVSVTMIPANHCPGSSLYLFEKVVGRGPNPKVQRVLHCGDFRACPAHVQHPQLMPDIVDSVTGKTKQQKIDVCYLDTTYLNPRYAFPSQDDVIQSCADMCVSLSKDQADESDAWECVKKERAGAGMVKFMGTSTIKSEYSIAMEIDYKPPRGRLLVICGTYSIGKEKICLGIARALNCKIWAPPGKQRICAALEDAELTSRLTDDPREAQIHMQSLMEIRAETLQEYLNGFKPHFSRIVGFRPSGWNYRAPNSRSVESASVRTVLTSENWRSRYTMAQLVPQRGSTREAACFGVPYSEHSSFRELTMFCCALRIERVVPTVNVGSAASRAKMKVWIDRWLAERRKQGVIRFGEGEGEVTW